jgi:hypothetical protein
MSPASPARPHEFPLAGTERNARGAAMSRSGRPCHHAARTAGRADRHTARPTARHAARRGAAPEARA